LPGGWGGFTLARMQTRASVLISTYEQPRYLELALLGYARQSCLDFELLVADDGSGAETRALLQRMRADFPVPLWHVWQPDAGFRKAMALNRAVLQSQGARLIFSDGDCIPARDFVAKHLGAARGGRPGYAIGGHIRLDKAESDAITPAQVQSGAFESALTLPRRALLQLLHYKNLYYIAIGWRRRPAFYGLNFSVDRASFLRINGFDHNYGASARDDSDLRNRLTLAGVPPRDMWRRCIVYHLHHPANRTQQQFREQDAYYKRRDLQPEAPNGLRELEAESGAAAAGA